MRKVPLYNAVAVKVLHGRAVLDIRSLLEVIKDEA